MKYVHKYCLVLVKCVVIGHPVHCKQGICSQILSGTGEICSQRSSGTLSMKYVHKYCLVLVKCVVKGHLVHCKYEICSQILSGTGEMCSHRSSSTL